MGRISRPARLLLWRRMKSWPPRTLRVLLLLLLAVVALQLYLHGIGCNRCQRWWQQEEWVGMPAWP